MSQGSPRIILRLPVETVERIEALIERANLRTTVEPYTVSSWIRKAIMEKVAHLDRTEGTKAIAVVNSRLEEVE